MKVKHNMLNVYYYNKGKSIDYYLFAFNSNYVINTIYLIYLYCLVMY